MNEKKLLGNLKHKKRGALDAAIDHYTGYVSTIVYRTIGASATGQDMEEAVADTFIALWNYSDRLDETRQSVKGYLGVIARNMAVNQVRGMHYDLSVDWEEMMLKSQEDGPEETIVKREKTQTLQIAIKKMGEPDSEIFLRYFFRGQKLRQIATHMQMKLPTVKTRYSRGKKKLKNILIEMGYGYE